MRRPLLLVVLTLVGSLLAAPAGASEVVYEVHHIPVLDGEATVRIEIQRDTGFDRQPVLLTYSPYNNLNLDAEDRTANDGVWGTFGHKGYARAVADVIGTRGSTGCWDYGGALEQQSGVDVVNWLAAQEWSNGNVGMLGVSYEGTTATMVAARGDDAPGLKAIVPIAAISRWYGYAYQDGVRFFLNSFEPTDEGFDTPLAFDFGFGRTVAVDDALNDQEKLAETAAARTGECGSVAHTEAAYDRTPDYGDFWYERDYIRDAEGRVHDYDAAVFVVHGWQDFNVKQVEATNLYEALPVDDPETDEDEGAPFKLLWMTQSTHADGSGDGYEQRLEAFLEQTLKGRDHGLATIDRPVRTEGRTYDGPGEVHHEPSWPPPGTRYADLHLGRFFDYDVEQMPVQDGLVGSTGETGYLAPEPQDTGPWTWTDTGHASELIVENDPLNEPGHGYYSLFFQSTPLATDVRVAGAIELDAWVQPMRGAGAHLTPVVLDVAPDGTTQVAARGFLNLDYRNGLSEADPAPDGEWTHATVRMLPQDYTFQKGHRIAVLTMSSNTIWAVPGDRAGLVNIATGPIDEVTTVGSRLRLPVVRGAATKTWFTEDHPVPPTTATAIDTTVLDSTVIAAVLR